MGACRAKTHGRIVIYDRFYPQNQLGLVLLPHNHAHCQPTSKAGSLARLAGAHVPPQEEGGWEMGWPSQNMHFSLLNNLPRSPLDRFLT